MILRKSDEAMASSASIVATAMEIVHNIPEIDHLMNVADHLGIFRYIFPQEKMQECQLEEPLNRQYRTIE